ncbi:MAG: S1 RNA-binding domain-containing protein [Candidatus Absconditabacterales bacterium]|nr:S1 RNA-binding domain-containing protein [Candidatus Absconditabacterales bacterium]
MTQTALPLIREGQKITGIVRKHTSIGAFVDCAGGVFTAIILNKEVKDLQKNGVELLPGSEIEAELISTDIKHSQGYFIISVTKLLQVDIWNGLIAKAESEELMTVIPTEANLGGLMVDMHGIKGFIPLSQLAPIHYPRVEDGDQEMIFQKLLDLLGKEFKVKIVSIDEDERRVILSEREALRPETEKIMQTIAVDNVYDGIISGISSYGFFVTIGGCVEGLVHISELTYGHVNNIDELGKIGDPMRVKVIGLEGGKISLSAKKLKEDPWVVIAKTFKMGDIIEGEIVRYVPYGVFMRIFDDINGLIHLGEISDKGIDNPSQAVKIGQIVKAKIILLDIKNRRIGLSMRALYETPEESEARKQKKTARKPFIPKQTSDQQETHVIPEVANE